jgi:outer membrane lipoprotein SlyB
MIMVRFARVLTCLAAAGALSACVTVPPGPSQTSLPGSGKAWDQFQADDASCREIAAARGGVPNDAAAQAGAGSAVAGTVIGAAIGGLLGGGEGAAVGAGMGLFTGSVVGTGYAQNAAVVTQQSYDRVYFQCMYAAGHRIPVPAAFASSMRQGSAPAATRVVATPPPNAAIPPRDAPPPPGMSSATPPPNAAIPPRNAPPPPGASIATPPPNAAIPPPDAPPPYQLPR